MSQLEYFILLALTGGPLHGYAIKAAVAADSEGAVDPLAGTLYRVIARLITAGHLKEAARAGDREPHPGLERRYYALTPLGRRSLSAEAARLKRAATEAEKRLGSARGHS